MWSVLNTGGGFLTHVSFHTSTGFVELAEVASYNLYKTINILTECVPERQKFHIPQN